MRVCRRRERSTAGGRATRWPATAPGHYLSALAHIYEQTGDTACKERADYVVSELARAQKARGTGYVGALGRKLKDGTIVDGEAIFPEVMRGEIHSSGFDLNGSWSPLYTVHKVMAGLCDVHSAWGNPQALEVNLGLAGYFEKVFAALSDAQMEEMLHTEYGGLNESFAELSVQSGDKRWLTISERIYDHRVLDPLEAGQDKLANLHANTQVPKLVGLARIHELSGNAAPGDGASFFWKAVTEHHSYVIGGNADREYFSAPDTIAEHITEQTCEHCNTYNMLKLTRHLYSWTPNGSYFRLLRARAPESCDGGAESGDEWIHVHDAVDDGVRARLLEPEGGRVLVLRGNGHGEPLEAW